MPVGFEPLLHDERFTECRELAEKTLQRVGHTIQEAAHAHHAIACCSLAAGDVTAGTASEERALELSWAAEDWDLLGAVLVSLARAYGQVRRYRRQAAALQQYLVLLDQVGESRAYEVQARYDLGAAFFLLGELQKATECLNPALAAANLRENPGVADQCRHLLRQAGIRSGRLEGVPPLLADTHDYLDSHPEDKLAACDYWYDFAEYLLADSRPAVAGERALQAMLFADGSLDREVKCAILLHSCALRQQLYRQASSLALMARLRALQAGRADLVYDVNQHIDTLLSEHGPSVLDGVEDYFRTSGLNPFQYIPVTVGPVPAPIAKA